MATLLNQGAYGCVYYPGLTCKGNLDKRENYVTKIEIYDKAGANEIKISSIIRKIKNYAKHFSPTIKSCIITLNQIEKFKDKLEECKAVNISNNKYLYFLLLHIKYINGIELDNYIINIETPIIYISSIIKNYIYIINSLKLLYTKKILHYDLHVGNILYNKDEKIPIIIDFGLSIDLKKIIVNNKIDYIYLKKSTMFYAPEYENYPPEQHFITYLLKDIDKNTDKSDIENILEKKIDKEYILKFIQDIIERGCNNRKQIIYYHNYLYNNIHNIDNPNTDNLNIDNPNTDNLNIDTYLSTSNLYENIYTNELKKYYMNFLDMPKKQCIKFLLNYIGNIDGYILTINFSIIIKKIIKKIFMGEKTMSIPLKKILLFKLKLFLYNLRINPEKRMNYNQITKLYNLLFAKSLKLNKILLEIHSDKELNNKFIELEKYYINPDLNIFNEKNNRNIKKHTNISLIKKIHRLHQIHQIHQIHFLRFNHIF